MVFNFVFTLADTKLKKCCMATVVVWSINITLFDKQHISEKKSDHKIVFSVSNLASLGTHVAG